MSHKHFIKSEAAHLINELENLEAFCKVARQNALELYNAIGYGAELDKRGMGAAAHELIRLSTGCQLSAAKIELAIQFEIGS